MDITRNANSPYQQLSSVDGTTLNSPAQLNDNNRVSSEYTPLLEDFTERFINRSQLIQSFGQSMPNDPNIPAASVISPTVVPPELLMIHYQQSPFNPNLIVASDTSSLSSYSFDSHSEIVEAYIHGETTNANGDYENGNSQKICSRICKIIWCTTQIIMVVSLMAYNFGSTLTPSIYSTLFIPPIDSSSFGQSLDKMQYKNTTNNYAELLVINLVNLTFIQLFMSILALFGSLTLLYSASKILLRLRKRNLKYQCSIRHHHPTSIVVGAESVTVLTMEMIVAEILGRSMAWILSLIMIVHQFCLCCLHVHQLYDFFDMSISSFKWFNLNELLSQQKWFLNHQVLCSLWLTLSVIFIFGTVSFRFPNNVSTSSSINRLYSLWILKILAIFFGMLSIVFIPIAIVYHGNQSMNSSSHHVTKYERKYSSLYNYNQFTNNNYYWYLSLLGTIPLLLMPFHLNEILIMLIFSQYDYSYYKKLQNSNFNESPRSRYHISNHQSIQTSNNTNAIAPSLLLYLSSPQSMESSVISSFFFKSFSIIRNWYIFVAFLIFLFQVIMNIFYFYFTSLSSRVEDSFIIKHESRNMMNSFIELNFLRKYFNIYGKSNLKNELMFEASILLLLKTTILYLLMLFRGKMAQDWLLVGRFQKSEQILITKFQFTAPYIIWNCLALSMALLIEYFPWILHLQIWMVGFFTIILLLFYPSMLLLYFVWKNLKTNNLNNQQQRHTQQLNIRRSRVTSSSRDMRFKPIRWPKIFLAISLVLLLVTPVYLIFWVYGYFYGLYNFSYFTYIRHSDSFNY